VQSASFRSTAGDGDLVGTALRKYFFESKILWGLFEGPCFRTASLVVVEMGISVVFSALMAISSNWQ
jgi:hypothetical protein